jgi:hypothetical protein
VSILEIVKGSPGRIIEYVVIWVILSVDVAMIASRADLRLAAIVVAAMLGMLSADREAAGCSANSPGGGKARASCCAGNSRSACCCGAEKAEPRPRPIERTAVGVPIGGGRLLAPDSPCECRAGDPTEPASKPGLPSSRHRTDQDGARYVERIPDVRPAIAIARFVLPTESPPGAPLYLRMSHLLI